MQNLPLRIGVVTAGSVLASLLAAPAVAAGSALAVNPGTTTLTTLNHGVWISGDVNRGQGNLPQRLANATIGIRVTNATKDPVLLFDGYAPLNDVTVEGKTAHLFYRQKDTANTSGPVSGWTSLTARAYGDTADDSNDPGHRHLRRDAHAIFVTADRPGTYKFRLVDPGEEAGTGDDNAAPQITMVVKDINGDTGSALGDDWKPAVIAPTYVGVSKALTAKVDLTELTLVDARGTTNGVGLLNTAIADLTGIWWDSAVTGPWHHAPMKANPDAIGLDLRTAGTPTYSNYTSFDDVHVATGTGVLVGEFCFVYGTFGTVVAYGVACGAGVATGTTYVPTEGVAAHVAADGTATIPATTGGIDTLRHVGKVVSYAVFDNAPFRDVDNDGRFDLSEPQFSRIHNWTRLIYTEPSPSAATTEVKAVVPAVVTLSATPAKCVGACVVQLSGTALGAPVVRINGYGDGVSATVDPVTGTFSTTQRITRTTTFQASTDSGTSDKIKVNLRSMVTRFSVTKAGKCKIKVAVTGGPRGGGKVHIKVTGYSTRTYSAGSSGSKTVTLKLRKGKRTVTVAYTSPYSSKSSTRSKTVKVS
jgi:hypothetical protein